MRRTLLSLAAMFGMATASMAQVTYTCTAGSKFGEGEGCQKLFDGDVNTKYCGDAKGNYVLFTASEAVYVWGYEMTTANDNESYGRELKQWELYGTNDETAAGDANSDKWVSLSKYDNSGVIARLNFHKQLFYTASGASQTAYKYFKFVMRGDDFVQFSELSLCTDSKPALEYVWVEGSNDNTKKMVDKSLASKMEGNNIAGNWVIVETEDQTPHTIKSYAISTNDDGEWSGRAPKKWTVEGSNDKETWTLIDKVENDPILNQDGTTFEFAVEDKDAAYRYIKFTLIEMKGTGWTQVGEFHVFGTCAEHDWALTAGKEATCVEEGGAEYTCSACGTTKLTGTIPATGIHDYVDNHCTMCGHVDPSVVPSADGFYLPTTAEHFTYLAEMIQANDNVQIKLTQNVDLADFAGFGNGEAVVAFKGELDGQGYSLKNFEINTTEKNTGLFGKTDGANIHDVALCAFNVVSNKPNTGALVGDAKNTTVNRVAVIDGTKVGGYDHVGAVAGNTSGTTVITNCLSDADITSTHYQAGGLVGTSNGLTMEKCLFTGTVINNNNNAAGLVSLIDGEAAPTVLKNNISAATLLKTGNGEEYSLVNTGGRSGSYQNNRVAASTIYQTTKGDASDAHKAGETRNYTVADDNNGLTTADDEMKKYNFIKYTMGWDLVNDWKFTAANEYPVLAWMEGDAVQPVDVSAAGYATVIAGANVTIPEGVDAYAAQVVNDKYVHFEKIEGAIPANEAFVLKASEGTYTLAYIADAAAIEDNDLKAATAEVETDGTQYILANGGEGIGFYKATGTIAAGKGYLVSAAGEVKVFLFGDDSATAISNVETTANQTIYNMAGQRIQKMQQGVNIVDGKKVMK